MTRTNEHVAKSRLEVWQATATELKGSKSLTGLAAQVALLPPHDLKADLQPSHRRKIRHTTIWMAESEFAADHAVEVRRQLHIGYKLGDLAIHTEFSGLYHNEADGSSQYVQLGLHYAPGEEAYFTQPPDILTYHDPLPSLYRETRAALYFIGLIKDGRLISTTL